MIRRMQAWSQDPGRDWCGACLCGDHHQCQGSFDAMGTHEPQPCRCTHDNGDADGYDPTDAGWRRKM